MSAPEDFFGNALDDALDIDRDAVEGERQRVNDLRLAALNGDHEARQALIAIGDAGENQDDDESTSGT